MQQNHLTLFLMLCCTLMLLGGSKWGVDMWHPLVIIPRNVYSYSQLQADLGRVRANSITTVTPLSK
jgi:hypothetical protein